MGLYSWKFADTKNRQRLMVGAPAYVACPDGTFIFSYYDGYGHFDGKDIWELVADWNRNHLDGLKLKHMVLTEDGEIADFAAGKSDSYMEEHYGPEWKRDIGIDIACLNENNRQLKFPIKICKDNKIPYNRLPASLMDPMQGCD